MDLLESLNGKDCGTGRVTACLRQFGLSSSFGVDHIRPRNCVAPVSPVDLTTKRGRDLLASWLKNPRVVGVFLAPPCGTASRARSIKLKRKRNAPNGLKFLSFVNKMKISQANKLYHLTAQVVKYAVKDGMIVCVENPQFSLFWATTFWVSVAKLLRYTIFIAVNMEAIARRKRCLPTTTKLLISCPNYVQESPKSIVTYRGVSPHRAISRPVKKQHILFSWLAMSHSASHKH